MKQIHKQEPTFATKNAWIFVCGHYLFQKANRNRKCPSTNMQAYFKSQMGGCVCNFLQRRIFHNTQDLKIEEYHLDSDSRFRWRHIHSWCIWPIAGKQNHLIDCKWKKDCIWREKLHGYLSIYPRAKLEENCELWQTVNTTIDKVSKHIF